ncbi:MAG: 1-deoxy-D-xylulose-5-phosphate reductoisomerase [Bacteroidales bacterium]|nr:1-deoxy-D-xylulose-5-phosphate reductoisomerase [Bacteroidales bacterium]MCL2132734.1 1-deoxy-D-xylulose-5-phosphate reductoisomerase [Bacteroidales bacterium]
MKKKHISILGATGSIGTQTLDIIRRHADLFEVEVLTAHGNADLLIRQAIAFQPNAVVIADEKQYDKVRDALADYPIKVYAGHKAVTEVAAWDTADMVVSALVGFAGLSPTLAALNTGKAVALANKETLVAGGALVIATALENKAAVIPIDSEHSAIFQCLAGEQSEIEKIYLTASGGPFLHTNPTALSAVTKQQALKHPNWNMGAKVTIDSATMMNKGLEVIEAHWFFGLPSEKIEALVHPQSIIHSMVQFADGAIKAQLGLPDMQLPIQYALSYPMRLPMPQQRIDFSAAKSWDFFPPDTTKFPCLSLAYEALNKGGNIPCAMNAANEIAVQAFLNEQIKFTAIPTLIEKTMYQIPFISQPDFDDLVQTDLTARTITQQNI